MADIKQVVEKVKGAQNILVALSKNPSVDEVSAALGLTLMLDKIGKKATAIYSGETPDVLRFLNPEKTFSTDTNALQDFIIALDKDKADHLRYKVDGDYVKVFITPYHEAISESDLEYSYGDFNVDLIIALDVAEEKDLDGALVEYGRIMHDAGVINITTSSGGKFSEMEWSNPEASSVSEMITELGAELAEDAFEKNSATALLTGIVASTERFANEKTTPETMGAAAKLMKAGAEQRLIAENMERVEKGQSPVPLDDAFSEESPSSGGALLTRRTSSTSRFDAPPSSDNLSENASDGSLEPQSENELEGREISENASDEKLEEESTEKTAEESEKETTEGTTEKTEEEPEEKLAEEPAEEESAEGEKSAEKESETPEKEEPAVDLQAAAEMTKGETEDASEEESQKPILETPIELADSSSFSEESPSSEDALSSPFSDDSPSSEDALLPRGTQSTARSATPSSSDNLSENDLEEKSVGKEPEEKSVEEAPVETPKVELSGRAEPAKEKMEDATHKTVKLQPSAEAQAELEEIMKEEPKKNELLDELNKYTGDQATSGGLKPDVGLSSIDTDNIGKTEVKDYSQMMSEALDGDGGMPNPAVQAAPAVMTGPEANHIPEMDYSQVSNAEAEQPPMMQNGMLESEPSEKPVGAAKEGMTAETEPTEAQAPGMMAPSEGMTEDILPPPPAPPVDGGVMPPTKPSAAPMPVTPTVPVAPVEPVAPTPVETPPMATPVTPVVPVVPTTPAAPVSTPAEAPAQVGPTPTNDDPAAFRIPGM